MENEKKIILVNSPREGLEIVCTRLKIKWQETPNVDVTLGWKQIPLFRKEVFPFEIDEEELILFCKEFWASACKFFSVIGLKVSKKDIIFNILEDSNILFFKLEPKKKEPMKDF